MKVSVISLVIALVVFNPLAACGSTVKFRPGQYCGSYKVGYHRVLELSAKANQTLSVEALDNTDRLGVLKNGVNADIEILEGRLLSHLQEDGTYTVTPYPVNPAKPMLLRVCVLDEDRL